MPILRLSCARRPGIVVSDRLIQKLTDAIVEELQVPPSTVNILVEYVDVRNWAVGAERLEVKYGSPADAASGKKSDN